jgi:hypothetical protein
MDRITSFLNDLPGYTGYRDKETRRDSDKRLRDSIADQLASIADRVERAGAALVQRRELDKSQSIEQLVRSLNLAANRIRSQSYGYGGIFSDTPVDERVLGQLFLFDKGLATKVDQLDAQLGTVETDLTSGAPIEPVIDEARKSIQSLLLLLDTRGTVVETAAPAPQRSVFTPLDESRDKVEKRAAPIEISVGDAVSHLGDDYIVNAVIEVRDGDSNVRLYRVESDPDKWLAISDRGRRMAALLDEASGGAPAGSHATGGTVSWSLAGAGEVREQSGKPVKADASVIVYEWKDEPERVALEVHSGADERYLSGHRIHPDDLAVYGRPGSTG